MKTRFVLFEDSDGQAAKLEKLLGDKLKSLDCTFERFSPISIPVQTANKKVDFGELLASYLLTEPETGVAVLDVDLTEYEGPVTRGVVHATCTENNIPLAVYHFVTGPDERARNLQRWKENEITLDYSDSMSQIANQCFAILKGFLTIRSIVDSQWGKNLNEIVSVILRAPQDAEIQIGQYTWGGSKSLELLHLGDRATALRGTTTLLGYWIRNQLLQFPGVILDTVAAAAHLDVDHVQFATKSELQSPFSSALYSGPFGDLGPFWWTTGLDDILSQNTPPNATKMFSGHDYLKSLGKDVPRSRCIEGHEGTGYYCIIEKLPVCAEHSTEPQGWLPAGATKSRISKRTYDANAPWKVV